MKQKVSDYRIGTLGSHSALQILRGARDENMKNLVVCTPAMGKVYRSYHVADEIVEVDTMTDVVGLEQQLLDKNVILIPHGSYFAAYGLEALNKSNVKYFGNKAILGLEEDRGKQRDWLAQAGLKLPKIYNDPKGIDGPVIIKFHGAGGGKGYFLASNAEEFERKIAEHPNQKYIIQQYVVGAPMYIHYFYSPLTGELEIMSLDRRYETNVDSIGRISAKDQMDLNIETSYNIIGNTPVVVRESLLPKMFEMGEAVVKTSQELVPRGLFGPFCLECIITPELDFIVFEISARIVAGTNPYIKGSPYTDLRYDEPMSTGRRVAREIKTAIEQDRLKEILSD